MYLVMVISAVILALILIGVVLIRESKGGGLSTTNDRIIRFRSVRETVTILEKTTWYLAALLVVISVLCEYSYD